MTTAMTTGERLWRPRGGGGDDRDAGDADDTRGTTGSEKAAASPALALRCGRSHRRHAVLLFLADSLPAPESVVAAGSAERDPGRNRLRRRRVSRLRCPSAVHLVAESPSAHDGPARAPRARCRAGGRVPVDGLAMAAGHLRPDGSAGAIPVPLPGRARARGGRLRRAGRAGPAAAPSRP